MRLILDTNVYSDYAEGKPEVVDIIARKAREICFPAIVLGELYYGFGKSSRKKLNEQKIEQFINLFHVGIIAVDENVSRKYALIYEYLEKNDVKFPLTMFGLPLVAWLMAAPF